MIWRLGNLVRILIPQQYAVGLLVLWLAPAVLLPFLLTGCAARDPINRGGRTIAAASNSSAAADTASLGVKTAETDADSTPHGAPQTHGPRPRAIEPIHVATADVYQVAHWSDPSGQPKPPRASLPDASTQTLPTPRVQRLPPLTPEAVIPQPVPPPPGHVEIPLDSSLPPGQVDSQGPLVTVAVRETPLHSVLSLLAQQQGISIVSPSNLETPVTVTLQPTTLENALDAVTAVCGCTWTRVKDVIYVTPITKDAPESFLEQGEVRVFDLNYVSATDAEKVVTGLLSPVGKVFARQIDSKEKRKSIEQIVVEDLPPYIARIASYIARADEPPRQVMVEARILQIKLENDTRHGVNFDALTRVAGADVTFATQLFATGLGPAGIITVDGTDFDSLIDCLQSTNDTKTLAAPKLLMINGQESKIQIGRRLGYFVTTTTQTSTLQDVQFLEVGVVLTVTPQITADGQIVMKVRPKVSNGDINPSTTLPEEETTEVDTSIMVPDGHGVIIGGLIQELDNERQSKVPFLGDIWLMGRLFQRRVVERERSEVVVALLPRIVPYGACPTPPESADLQRIAAPLVTPTLESAPRPEPRLPDAVHDPIWPRRSTP